MPYNYDPNLDDPNKDAAAQAPGGAEKTQLAGGSQVAGGSSSTDAQGAPSQSAGTRSDTFQNLNDYLSANAGNGFGGQFAGKLQGEVDKANQAQTDSAGEFKNASDQGAVKYNADLVNQAASDPTNFISNPDQVSAFTKQRDASYAGPTQYADDASAYQKAAGATKRAQDYTNAADNEGGRFALLDSYFGKPEYSQGQKGLDNLLISGDQTAQQGIAQAKANAGTAQQNFQGQGTDLANYAATNRATTESTKQKTNDAFTGEKGAIPTLQNGITQRLADYTTKQDSDYNQFQNALSSRMLNDDQLSLLGLKTGDSTYGVDPTKYLTKQAPTIDSVMSKDDYARLKALDEIMGIDNTFNGDPSQVGTFDPAKDVNFDQAGYQTARGGAMNAYSSQKSAADQRNQLDQNILQNWFSPNGAALRDDPQAQQEYQRLAGLAGKTTVSSDDVPKLNAQQQAEYQQLIADLAAQYKTRDTFNQPKVMDVTPKPRVIRTV